MSKEEIKKSCEECTNEWNTPFSKESFKVDADNNKVYIPIAGDKDNLRIISFAEFLDMMSQIHQILNPELNLH